jgi:hypothetical protein
MVIAIHMHWEKKSVSKIIKIDNKLIKFYLLVDGKWLWIRRVDGKTQKSELSKELYKRLHNGIMSSRREKWRLI